ncbi:hypothetical protein HRbin02_00033 [Candidatus Calditenuaceae archaeon HR02]|nr:hypothetical protein HRbin02_00033 [Candidatus Calditenuaceae archaeon HR02]
MSRLLSPLIYRLKEVIYDVARVIVALGMQGLEASPELHRELLERAKSILANIPGRLVDVRIGRRRVEVDVLTSDVNSVVSALAEWAPIEYFREIVEPRAAPDDRLVQYAAELFNDERYWEAHEVLENVWRGKKGAERELLYGLIKTAAAFVHAQKGQTAIYFRLLEAALKHLNRWEHEQYYCINIERLRGEIQSLLMSDAPKFIKMPM